LIQPFTIEKTPYTRCFFNWIIIK